MGRLRGWTTPATSTSCGAVALAAILILAAAAMPRSVLRAGLVDVQFETGRQERYAPGWKWVDVPEDPLSSRWELDPSWHPGRTWTLGVGVFANDNFRFGLRWQAITTGSQLPSPLDSSIVSLEAAFFSRPEGPLSALLALRAGIAPGFPSRDPPDHYPLYGVHVPDRVYGFSLGARWIPTPRTAIDLDLLSADLWSSGTTDVWHLAYLTPRVSLLF